MKALYTLLVICISQLVLSTPGTAQLQEQGIVSQNCPGSSGDTDDGNFHEEILKHAILAELAYGQNDENQESACQDYEEGWKVSEWYTQPVPDVIINEAIDTYNQGGEVAYIKDSNVVICRRGSSMLDLKAAYKFTVANDQLSLLIKIGIATAATIGTEEFKFVILEGENGLILGVAGTDQNRMEQWSTSVMELIGSSCLFDFSVDLAIQFFNSENLQILEIADSVRFGVVGHSLGGAIVQHLVMNERFGNALEVLRGNRNNNDFGFRGYSFNSIGVADDPSSQNNNVIGSMISVRIAGEILENIETQLGRRQIGHIYRYNPQYNDLDMLRDRMNPNLRAFLNENLEIMYLLHSIDAVKQTICQCLSNSNGQFEYGFQR